MVRRELLGLMGIGALGLVAADEPKGQGDGHQHHEHGKHIETMGRCAMLCAAVASHCLDALRKGEGDREAHANALAAASGCEKFCITGAALMACDNPMQKYIHGPTAHACTDCAEACSGVEGEIMKQCAEACRECAQMCREMAQMQRGQDQSKTQQRQS